MDVMLFSLFWVFGWVVVLLFIWYVRSGRRHRRLEHQHAERMLAMEKGVPLPELPVLDEASRLPLVSEAIGQARINPRWPLGMGALCILSGLGVCVALWLSPEDDFHRRWSMGLIGVFFGLGLVVHYLITRPPAGPRSPSAGTRVE